MTGRRAVNARPAAQPPFWPAETGHSHVGFPLVSLSLVPFPVAQLALASSR